ncbi:MAG: class II aldolase/adducin family protein [Armatimonadota bacterium]
MCDIKEELIRVCALIYQRRLSDSAGGNVSVRSGGKIYVTPRYMGSRRRWQITAEEIVELDADRAQEQAAEHPMVSREVKVHLAVYQAFERAGAVIHAHPENLMVFASAECPLPPTSDQTAKFGTVPVVPYAKAHTQALADVVVEALRPMADGLENHGIACILPRHGVVIVGRDLDDAYDTLERLDGSARIYLMRRLLERA